MALISNSTTLKTIHFRLTPTKDNFNVEAFEDWLGDKTDKGKGREYINLQAKTTAGQKRLAWFNKFNDLDETFWEHQAATSRAKRGASWCLGNGSGKRTP